MKDGDPWTIHNLLDEVRDRGWLVSNLFQRDNGSWQANLRTFTHHTEFGRGPTPELALSMAIEVIETATETPTHEPVQVSTADLPTFSLSALLAGLRPRVEFKGKLP